jgi:uncharacterized membrane protein YqiK
MRRTTPEAWMFVLLVIAIVVIPIVVGILLIKLYRKFRPLEEFKGNTLAATDNMNRDGFFKIIFVGWAVCGPVFYIVYSVYLAR